MGILSNELYSLVPSLKVFQGSTRLVTIAHPSAVLESVCKSLAIPLVPSIPYELRIFFRHLAFLMSMIINLVNPLFIAIFFRFFALLCLTPGIVQWLFVTVPGVNNNKNE